MNRTENNPFFVAAFMVPHPPMIVPEIGRGSESTVVETTRAYEHVADEIASLKPETIIITSPHSVMYRDYFHISPGSRAEGDFGSFGAPKVSFSVDYDKVLAQRICRISDMEGFPAGTLGEKDRRLDHGTMVPLWFITQKYKDFRLVRCGLSGLSYTDHYRFGMIIKRAIEEEGRRTVIVASGDLSHKLKDYGPYGFTPEGPEYDARIMDVCGRGAFGELLTFDPDFCDRAAECGHRSFVIMAGAFDGEAVNVEKLSHQDVTGVGYGICTFKPAGADGSRHFLDEIRKKAALDAERLASGCDPYVKLAWQSLTGYILNGKKIGIPEDLPLEMTSERAGAFVSIHKNGQLRGCIGTIAPVTQSMAQEIINNAVSASTEDPRFSPIAPEEISSLEINVDILSEAEDIDSPDKLDVKRYGVIVTSGTRRGLLLPDLEGVDTVDEQIAIAMRKAGIRPGEKINLKRFEVIRHR